MFAILLAVIQTAAPVTAECTVTGSREGMRLTRIGLVCPNVETDPEGLRAVAAGVIDRLEDSYDARALRVSEVTTELVFEHDGGAWRLPAPEKFLYALPDYPPIAAERGYGGRCDLAVTLDTRGRPDEIAIECGRFLRPDRFEPSRIFERNALRAAERAVYFMPDPAQGPACVETWFDFYFDTDDRPSRPVDGAPQCPEGAATDPAGG